jgi:hypothetical protein
MPWVIRAGKLRHRPPRELTMRYPTTPDGRYFVVRGRLWRCSNPALSAGERDQRTKALMKARRAKGVAIRAGDAQAKETARVLVDRAKVALGERGEPWWQDGAPDWNRNLVKNTPYADWFLRLDALGT